MHSPLRGSLRGHSAAMNAAKASAAQADRARPHSPATAAANTMNTTAAAAKLAGAQSQQIHVGQPSARAAAAPFERRHARRSAEGCGRAVRIRCLGLRRRRAAHDGRVESVADRSRTPHRRGEHEPHERIRRASGRDHAGRRDGQGPRRCRGTGRAPPHRRRTTRPIGPAKPHRWPRAAPRRNSRRRRPRLSSPSTPSDRRRAHACWRRRSDQGAHGAGRQGNRDERAFFDARHDGRTVRRASLGRPPTPQSVATRCSPSICSPPASRRSSCR